MSAQLAVPMMTVEEFLAWSEGQEGNYELEDGVVVAMAPDRIVHARARFAVVKALSDAVVKAGIPCEAFMEGPGLRVDARTSYQPDAVVQCGPRLPGDVRMVDNPVVVVEILSPSTAYRDLGRKARGYFRVPSVAHYLIVDADDRVVSHRRRGQDGTIVETDHVAGDLRLDPPGLVLSVADLLPADR